MTRCRWRELMQGGIGGFGLIQRHPQRKQADELVQVRRRKRAGAQKFDHRRLALGTGKPRVLGIISLPHNPGVIDALQEFRAAQGKRV